MRVLIFGASVVQGFWDSEGGWVNRLRKYYDSRQLEDIKKRDEPTVFNLGISGDTVQGLSGRFKNETEARKFEGEEFTFVFSIGTNNAAEGMERGFDPDEYETELNKVVKQAKKYSSRVLLVGLPCCDEGRTTPVFWRDIYYTNDRIKAIEDRAKKVSEEANIPFVPIFDRFKAKLDAGEDLLTDGLHPNEEGHRFIADLVRPELDKVLTDN